MTSDTQSPAETEAVSSAPSRSRIGALLARLASGDVTRGVVGTMILKAISAAAGFAMFALAARSMTGEDFGHLVMWFSVAQIACVVGLFGQEMLVTRKLGEYTATGQPQYVKGLMLFSMVVAAMFCIAVSIVVGLFTMTVQHAGIALSIAIIAFMLANTATMLGSQITRFFVGIMVADGSRQFLWRFIIVGALAAAIAFDRKVTPAEFLLMAAVTLTVVAGIHANTTWRHLPPRITGAKAAWKIKDWLAMSARLVPSGALEATNQYFDVVVIYWLLDPVAAGGYYAASRLANLFAILLDALFTYAARYVPPLYFAGRRDELKRHLTQMAEVVLFCVICGLAVFVFGAKPLLGAFGESFIDQRMTLIVLAIGTALQALGGPSAVLLLTTGHEAAYTWTIAANVAMRLLGFCVMIPLFGVIGAAAATAISLAITTAILNRLCRSRVGFDPSVLTLVPSWRPAPQDVRSSASLVKQPAHRSSVRPS